MIILIVLSQSVCMPISCECLHEHFISIMDVNKSQSSQPPHGRVHSRLTHCAQNSCPQSLESPVFIIVLKASLDGEPVALCCMYNWSLACQQFFSEYVILKATNRILFKKKKIEHVYSSLCSDASCDQLLCVTVFTTCMQYPKINVCICHYGFMSKYNCIQSYGNVEVSVLYVLTITQNIVCD